LGGKGEWGTDLGKGWAGGERRWIELLSDLFWCDIPLRTGTHGVWVGMNGLCSVLEGGVKGYHVLRLIPCLFDYVCYGDTIDAGLGEGGKMNSVVFNERMPAQPNAETKCTGATVPTLDQLILKLLWHFPLRLRPNRCLRIT